jgi:hypothetical protein
LPETETLAKIIPSWETWSVWNFVSAKTGAEPRAASQLCNQSGFRGPGGIFFIWIRYNPLKSPNSAKEIQGNPS